MVIEKINNNKWIILTINFLKLGLRNVCVKIIELPWKQWGLFSSCIIHKVVIAVLSSFGPLYVIKQRTGVVTPYQSTGNKTRNQKLSKLQQFLVVGNTNHPISKMWTLLIFSCFVFTRKVVVDDIDKSTRTGSHSNLKATSRSNNDEHTDKPCCLGSRDNYHCNVANRLLMRYFRLVFNVLNLNNCS